MDGPPLLITNGLLLHSAFCLFDIKSPRVTLLGLHQQRQGCYTSCHGSFLSKRSLTHYSAPSIYKFTHFTYLLLQAFTIANIFIFSKSDFHYNFFFVTAGWQIPSVLYLSNTFCTVWNTVTCIYSCSVPLRYTITSTHLSTTKIERVKILNDITLAVSPQGMQNRRFLYFSSSLTG